MAKVAGTNNDKRRKVTNSTIYRMNQMVAAGKSLSTVAEKYGVSTYTVKYHTDPKFKASEAARKKVTK